MSNESKEKVAGVSVQPVVRPRRKAPYVICQYCKKPVRVNFGRGSWIGPATMMRHDGDIPDRICAGSYRTVADDSIKWPNDQAEARTR